MTLERGQALGQIIARTATRYPDRRAIIWRGTEETYADFNAAVNRVAWSLSKRKVAKGDRVAILSHNCREFVVCYLALAKLGAILVPINFMLRAEEAAYILQDCGVIGMIAEDSLADIAEQALELADIDTSVRIWISLAALPTRPGWETAASLELGGPHNEPLVEIADDDPIQLMYTSGTESRPKGVLLTSRSLMWQYVSCALDGEMTSEDVEVHALPFYHCAQLHCFFSVDVYLGATNIILDGPDPEHILRAIEEHRATKLFCPPTVWIALLAHPDFERRDLSSLSKGYYGAAPMPAEVLRELSARLPRVRLWNFYGQTEMSPMATVLKPEDQMIRLGSAGKACLNVQTRIVDDNGEDVPAGAVGEIVHRSPQIALGYWNDGEKSADAFRHGWFHSGDLGMFDDEGYLMVIDRKKDMIKTGGENVASREVEEVIFEHETVREVAVFGIPHDYWIEAVTAVVVPMPGEHPTSAELIDFSRQKLAPFKVPKYVAMAKSLPKNPSGKILKRELRQIYASLAEGELSV